MAAITLRCSDAFDLRRSRSCSGLHCGIERSHSNISRPGLRPARSGRARRKPTDDGDNLSFEREFTGDAESDWIALLEFLGDVRADLLEVRSLDQIARILDETVDQIISVQYPVLYLYNADEEQLDQVWSEGFTPEERRIAESTALDRHPGWVLRNAEGFYVPDVEKDADDRTEGTARSVEVRSRLYHPVITQGECIGAFGFAASEPHAFDREHIAALGFYSSLIGAAYGRLRRERRLRETRQHIERTNELLRAIREVSQLMVRERDLDRIVQTTSELLVETSSYRDAFILGRNASGEPTLADAASDAATPEGVDALLESPVGSEIRALYDGDAEYFSAPVDGEWLGDDVVRSVGVSLDYAGIIHGVLVLGSSQPAPNPEEQTLLEGVANDVAFVSHMLEEVSEDEQIADQALRDWLTDLPNRALFQNRLSPSIARAERDDDSFALLLVDLDNLKEVNDSLGHAAGDRLPVRVSERLRECCVRTTPSPASAGTNLPSSSRELGPGRSSNPS